MTTVLEYVDDNLITCLVRSHLILPEEEPAYWDYLNTLHGGVL